MDSNNTRAKYFRIKKERTEDDKPPDNEIRITTRGTASRYIARAGVLFLEKEFTHITLKAAGKAISTLCIAVDVIRRRIKALHQINYLRHTTIVDEFEPREEGLDEIKIEKKISVLEIKLTKEVTEEEKKEAGYQGPLPEGEVEEMSLENIRRGGGGGTGGRRGGRRGNRRGGNLRGRYGDHRGSGGQRRTRGGYSRGGRFRNRDNEDYREFNRGGRGARRFRGRGGFDRDGNSQRRVRGNGGRGEYRRARGKSSYDNREYQDNRGNNRDYQYSRGGRNRDYQENRGNRDYQERQGGGYQERYQDKREYQENRGNNRNYQDRGNNRYQGGGYDNRREYQDRNNYRDNREDDREEYQNRRGGRGFRRPNRRFRGSRNY